MQNLICAAAKMWSKRTDALSLKVKVYMILLKGWMMTADWCVRTAFELEKRGRGLSFPVCRSQEWQDVDRCGAKLVDPASVCFNVVYSLLTKLLCHVRTQILLPCAPHFNAVYSLLTKLLCNVQTQILHPWLNQFSGTGILYVLWCETSDSHIGPHTISSVATSVTLGSSAL